MNFLSNWWNKVTSKDYWQPTLKFWGVKTQFNDYTEDAKKLTAIFSNPSLLKVFCLQCDLFSLGQIYVYNKKDRIIDGDPALDLLSQPNPLQNKSQFLWDYMFWNMVGTAYCYVDSDAVDKTNNKLYFLDITKIEWPAELQKDADKLIFSTAKEDSLMETMIKYRYTDGTYFEFKLKKLIIMTDLTNGVGNWFKSPSRIDALYKIISNSEATMDANNINTRFSGKFMVAGTPDPSNVTQTPLGDDEKQSIEQKMNGNKEVHAVKSMIEIKRFVENMRNMVLNENFLAQYFIIGNMFGIPRDVLEAYQSATYENQEKARASHVSYTLQPKGNDFMDALSKRWGYSSRGWKLVIDWAHLPFMQVFEKDRALTEQIKVNTFNQLLNNGVPIEEVNRYLDLDFTRDENKTAASKKIVS